MSVLDATEVAIKAAADYLTDKDAGALQALRVLAAKIDTDDDVREAYLEMLNSDDAPSWAKPMQVDNVSIPTYLKYCESLGLTPAGRLKFGETKEARPVGKLASIQGGIRKPA